MADNIESRIIRIDEIEQKADRIILKEGRAKYSFWLKKRDGTPTKAFEGWDQLRPLPGDTIDIQYKSEEAEFMDGGKAVQFTRRTILNMRDSKGAEPTGGPSTTPASNPAPRSNSEPTGVSYVPRAEYEEKIKQMSEAFMKMQDEINRIKTAIGLTDEE